MKVIWILPVPFCRWAKSARKLQQGDTIRRKKCPSQWVLEEKRKIYKHSYYANYASNSKRFWKILKFRRQLQIYSHSLHSPTGQASSWYPYISKSVDSLLVSPRLDCGRLLRLCLHGPWALTRFTFLSAEDRGSKRMSHILELESWAPLRPKPGIIWYNSSRSTLSFSKPVPCLFRAEVCIPPN